MRKSAWGPAFISFGLLAACGSKTPPASSSANADSSAVGPADWASVCKIAKARAPRCGVSDQTVQDCEKIDGCTERPFDTSAPAVLAKCLADSDCDACAKAATASPSAAGKAFFATAADYEKRCQRSDDLRAFVTKVGGLFNSDSLKPFSDCMQMPNCDDAASCAAKLHMGDMSVMANSQCTGVLGLATTAADQPNIPPPPPPPPPAADVTGQLAPELAVTALGKAAIPTMKSLKGKVVVVHFWASWCVPCKKTMPMLDAFAKKHAGKVVVIGVSEDDTADDAKAFLKQTHVKFVNAIEDAQKTTAHAYGLKSMPETIVIGRDGNVSQDIVGGHFDVSELSKSL